MLGRVALVTRDFIVLVDAVEANERGDLVQLDGQQLRSRHGLDLQVAAEGPQPASGRTVRRHDMTPMRATPRGWREDVPGLAD